MLYRYKTLHKNLHKKELPVKNQTFRMTMLFDFYGELLTDRQKEFYDLYYNEDLSLSEIAENYGISRQGVRDAIKRAENQLFEMVSCLGLAKKFETLKKGLEEIEQCAEAINAYNLSHTLSREINDNVARIKALTAYLCE